jgi:hypothetical protein
MTGLASIALSSDDLPRLSEAEATLRYETLALLRAAEDVRLAEGDLELLTFTDRLMESAKTATLAVTHAPIGKGGKNWITASKPGNKGQLPAYIQNVRNAIMRGGTEEGRATGIAIGKVQDWAEGKGDVSPEVRAAAGKAIAEWERMKAAAEAKSKLKEGQTADAWGPGPFWLTTEDVG